MKITNSVYLKYLTRNTWPVEGTSPACRGEGIYFWDYDGKRFMDFSSQTLNLLLGQCHPALVDAITEQAKTLTYASSRFSSMSYFKTAEKLVQIAPDGFTKVNIKMCDGSDANETGVKIARKYTGKTGIISFNQGHTGQTTQTIQLRGYGRDPRTLAGNTDDIVFVNPPNCKEEGDYKETLNELIEVIKTKSIAAILLDPMMVNAGVLVNSKTKLYLQSVNSLAKENGILLILDENQSFGWLPGLFATNYYGLSPDIITLGKGLSGGHPLAGVLVKEELSAVLDYNEADFTHGGHALSCAAAFACLNELETTDFEIELKYDAMVSQIMTLKEANNLSFSHRGVGLIHCIEFDNTDNNGDEIAEEVFNRSLERGLFLRRYNNKIVIKPPVIVTLDQISEMFEILGDVMKEMETLCI
ncbi:taurine---2-oxoglutarate transaminase [Paenibacillus sp. OK060]|uniref:aminotransferase class III-fold pyridoxal phosphate-dependent enzyme n=1 Tax=Paenibacillus sp. OK060 TaxID=1881034 RepID=UPI000886373E|nr:aminotransferase class III-fold pyridoxal phosphate-dependent enzyme [Paenibacillus sp. OK060]SDM33184.1 taurine---2-oxoglutarate transaminase [Paenibacillus sp. OK060]